MQRKPFLVPVGLALAALMPQTAAARSNPSTDSLVAGDVFGSRAGVTDRLRQPLLAVAHATRHLARAHAHFSHSSHASHASHASHFSSSVSPPATPPVAPGVAGVALAYVAALTTGTEVSAPVGAAGASGRFSATLSGNTLHWRLTLSSLSSAVTGAYLFSHSVSGGSTASPVQLCGPCNASASGSRVLSSAQLLSLMGGQSYVNVGTQTNPQGEVGGQVAMSVTSAPAPVTPPSGGGHFSHISHASHASHASHFSSSG